MLKPPCADVRNGTCLRGLQTLSYARERRGLQRSAREKLAQNDRAANNQSGLGSNPSMRDVTSGRYSGNQ